MNRKPYHGIKEEIGKHAGEAPAERRPSIKAMAHQVDAFNLLDDRIEDLQKDIRLLNRTTSRLMKAQIILIAAQIFLAVVALILTSKLPEYVLGR